MSINLSSDLEMPAKSFLSSDAQASDAFGDGAGYPDTTEDAAAGKCFSCGEVGSVYRYTPLEVTWPLTASQASSCRLPESPGDDVPILQATGAPRQGMSRQTAHGL